MATYGDPAPEKKKTNPLMVAGGLIVAATIFGSLLPDAEKAAQPKKEETVATLNRPASERCNSDTLACKEWTKLAIGCDENMKRRDEGYTGKLTPYCSAAENYREQVTGIASSTAPGAYVF